MKIKAIGFKKDGNTIKETYFEVVQVVEGIYRTNPDAENHYTISVIFQKQNIAMVMIDCTSIESLNNNLERVEKVYNDLENYLYNEASWVNKMHLEFAKQVGWDVNRLLQKRQSILAERESKEQAEQAEKKAKQLEFAKQHANSMQAIKAKLKEGSNVTYKELTDCIAFYKFYVHPRTLGTILKQPDYLTINTTSGRFHGKVRQSTINSIFEVVKTFNELSS